MLMDTYYIEFYSNSNPSNKWENKSDVFYKKSEPEPIKMVCFQIGESEESYIVCSMVNGQNCNGAIHIPKKCVTKRKRFFIEQDPINDTEDEIKKIIEELEND